MESNGIVTRTGKMWIDEETRLGWFVYGINAEVTLDDAKENVDAMLKLYNGRKHALLRDVSKCKYIDQKAREHFGGPRAREAYSAMALLGGSPIGNIIGIFSRAPYERWSPDQAVHVEG